MVEKKGDLITRRKNGRKLPIIHIVVLVCVLTVVVAVVAIFLYMGQVGQISPPQAELLTAAQEDSFTILENGDAIMGLSTTVPASTLSIIYQESYENNGENFKIVFQEGIQKRYKVLTGFDISVSDVQMVAGPDNGFRVSVDATASQVARFNSAEDLWQISVRPPEENDEEAAGYMLAEMMFAQMMLNSQPNRQRLELVSAIPIKLPAGATILNMDNLHGRNWKVDFGGGSYRESSVSVDEGQREVVLTERIVVTEDSPADPSEDLFRSLSEYNIFDIKYRLAGGTRTFASAAMEDERRSVKGSGSTDFSWTFDWSISQQFSRTFSHTVGAVTGEAGFTIDIGFNFKWYIGWDFKWVWKTGAWGIPYPSYELQWFRTFVETGPEIDVSLNASITGTFEKTWGDDSIWAFSKPITIMIGPVPVVIEVRVDIGGGIEVSAEGNISASAGATASATYKLGVEWTKSDGWGPIATQDYSLNYSGPDITAGAKASITPYLSLKLGAYFYWTAGPYVQLKPLVSAGLDWNAENPSAIDWLIEAGFDINAGVGFGAISEWIELPGWYTTLYSWRVPIASGTWGGVHPGAISGSVKDAVTRTSLSGVAITVTKGGSTVATGTTDANGLYSLSVNSGSGYSLEFSKSGYMSANYQNITVTADQTTHLEAVLQIDEAHSGTGNVSGSILNALTAAGVSGLTINLRSGINATTGTVVSTTTTQSGGDYSFTGLNAGNYTGEVSGSGYNTTYFTITCVGGVTTGDQDATITPILSSGETRIVLTWGQTPSDLDSHMTGPAPDNTRFHTYFGDDEYKYGGTTYANLDLDDTTSYGPETTTIYQQLSGVYRYSVHDFSDRSSSSSTALSNSGANVKVYRGSDLVATFNVPTGQGGTLWTVFELSGSTITPINTMSYQSSYSSIT